MSDMPAPVEQAPPETPAEAPAGPSGDFSEYGGESAGAGFGEAVDAFNDLDGMRPGSEGMSDMDGSFDNFEGENGQEDFSDDGEDGFSMAEIQADGDEDHPGSIEEPDDTLENQIENPENGNEPSDDTAYQTETVGGAEPPEPQFTASNESSEQLQNAMDNLNATQPNTDNTNNQPQDAETSDQMDESSKEGNKQPEGREGSKRKEERKPIPGDNMLSRLARGEPTKEDLEKLAKDQKRQKSGSAIPEKSSIPKGGGGSSHAQTERHDFSEFDRFIDDINAKRKKWDEIDSWNHQAIQRAKSQYEDLWKKLGK